MDRKILAHSSAAEFVGRERELAQIAAHAGSSGGLLVMSAPFAGASELLRQAFDNMFRNQANVIPFYFTLRSGGEDAADAATRFLQQFLTQTVAFRRSDVGILDASPEICELADIAVPEDGRWIDRLIETCHSKSRLSDERSFIRTCLSAPLRAAAGGARIMVMIDGLHHASIMAGGNMFYAELADIYRRADTPYVLAGLRRHEFSSLSVKKLHLQPLTFDNAGRLVEIFADQTGVAVNEQTRDLIALQLGGDPAAIRSIFEAAAAKNESLDTFARVEQIYTDEIFGGSLADKFDAIFDLISPGADARKNILRLLDETIQSGSTPVTYWQKNARLTADVLDKLLETLNIYEIVNVAFGRVKFESENIILRDYLQSRARLELAGESRALVVGEAVSGNIQRAPQLMARFYRRSDALGLREILSAFDAQEIAAALIDYAKFKSDLKGLGNAELQTTLEKTDDRVRLPQIVYTAHTAAFYPHLGELTDTERSAIALGFDDASFDHETVWIAAEIESKLEAAHDITEFWCDRLEMVAVNCAFKNYKLWLIAPEGFSDEAIEILNERGAFGSSRRQVELLSDSLRITKTAMPKPSGDEYEIVIPMGVDTEMIAAHTVEEIAKRHGFAPKAINQIKTALVEACINAVEHSLSPDRKIYQKFAVRDGTMTITVSNRGLRLSDKQTREITPDTGRRGWGLRLIQGLMDTVRIDQTDDGTRITMTKSIA